MSDTARENAKEWLENYDKPLRVRDGLHKLQIVVALAAYSDHQNSLLKAEVERLKKEQAKWLAEAQAHSAEAIKQTLRAEAAERQVEELTATLDDVRKCWNAADEAHAVTLGTVEELRRRVEFLEAERRQFNSPGNNVKFVPQPFAKEPPCQKTK